MERSRVGRAPAQLRAEACPWSMACGRREEGPCRELSPLSFPAVSVLVAGFG